MKTLKYLQQFFILLFVGFALYAVQACGNDGEDEPIQEPDKEEVVKPDEGEKDESDTFTGTINGHEWIDLGLSVKWATGNVGSSKPENYGDYYAWGETETKTEYTQYNSLTYGLSESQLQSQGYIDGSGNLTPSHDAARANWGGTWRLPTKAELEELKNKCTWGRTAQNGVKGYKVTGPNGNSIFLPAAGRREGSSLKYAGECGYCWSSTPDESDSDAYYPYFESGEHYMYRGSRYYGRSVRPVSE